MEKGNIISNCDKKSDELSLFLNFEKDIKSEKIINFIIFDLIKEFTTDLIQVYEDNAALINYNEFIQRANIIEDSEVFVKKFKKCLNGRHRAKYCDGAYIDIPEFLSDSENEETIRNSLNYISKIYKDVTKCPEWKFCNEKLEESLNISSPDQEENQTNEKFIEHLMMFFMNILKKYKSDFSKKELSIERTAKIPMIIIYTKLNEPEIVELIKNDIPLDAINRLLKISMRHNIKDLAKHFTEIMPIIFEIIGFVHKTSKNSNINLQNLPFFNKYLE